MPSYEDYIAAVQVPRRSFRTPRLQEAAFPSADLGLPLSATGRSAIVFAAKTSSGTVALRCFTWDAEGQRDRYKALGEYLRERPAAYLTSFTYHDAEILVTGKRFPVAEMEWSEGIPLHAWVSDHREEGKALSTLADTWLAIMTDMAARGIAHGDLANENCLVSDASQITLVDYDSFLIPEPMLTDPGEKGHTHFQHPQRDGYYARNMDAFPALVVYLSLLALSKDPGLWSKYHNGDNLLFTAHDYLAPEKAAVWRDLRAMGDPVVRTLAGHLARMSEDRIADLKSLSDVMAQVSRETWWAGPVEEMARRPRVLSPKDTKHSIWVPSPPQEDTKDGNWDPVPPQKVLLRPTRPLQDTGTLAPTSPNDDDWDFGPYGPRSPVRLHLQSSALEDVRAWAGVIIVSVVLAAVLGLVAWGVVASILS